jgi:hypothetical protein
MINRSKESKSYLWNLSAFLLLVNKESNETSTTTKVDNND